MNVAQKLIQAHLLEGEMKAGQEIGLRIDQTLTQDATGTLVMLELEAMQLDRVKTEVSVQYVDHNLIEADHKNADDHVFLLSGCQRFGLWYSRAGNGVSHPVHMQYFGKPGKSLLGSDSHTPAAGALGMLAIGAGGLDVAMAMAGQPFHVKMPRIWGVTLTGTLPPWVSAKDVILEMLRRHDVDGGLGHIVEYRGPGLDCLSAMDRHVIANMGAELGATTTVFPSDRVVRQFLTEHGRAGDWSEWIADPDASYDRQDEIDLSGLEPLIAKPSSPGDVVPVREVAGRPIYQAYIGSSANPGYRDFAIAAEIVKGRKVAAGVSLDINPTSRDQLEELIAAGHIGQLIHAGARLHQAGCNGCIGMGQAPATRGISLRTVPRNFPGRSGTAGDLVYLCSPETAAASALFGVITDPRDLGAAAKETADIRVPYPKVSALVSPVHVVDRAAFVAPLPLLEARQKVLVKGPNIESLPELDAFPDTLQIPIVLKVGDNISTDEILPAGANVLPYRSNIPRISDFAFHAVDPTYAGRALALKQQGTAHAILAGDNYGQGSSREHAALAPRYLGLRVVIAKSFARIHQQNLINFGVLPVILDDPSVYDRLAMGDALILTDLHGGIADGRGEPASASAREGGPAGRNPGFEVVVHAKQLRFTVRHGLSSREVEVLLAGGLTNWLRTRLSAPAE